MAYSYYDPFEPTLYTPAEILSFRANTEKLQNEAAMGNAGMNLGLNVAQLPADTGFGFLLGNILGRGLNNYFKQKEQDKINAAHDKLAIKQLGIFGQSLIPKAWQIQNNNRKALGMPANGEYFSQYNFSNYNKTPAEFFRQQNQLPNNQYWNQNRNLQPSFSNYNATPAKVFKQNQVTINPPQNFFPKQQNDFSNINTTLADAARQKGLLRW